MARQRIGDFHSIENSEEPFSQATIELAERNENLSLSLTKQSDGVSLQSNAAEISGGTVTRPCGIDLPPCNSVPRPCKRALPRGGLLLESCGVILSRCGADLAWCKEVSTRCGAVLPAKHAKGREKREPSEASHHPAYFGASGDSLRYLLLSRRFVCFAGATSSSGVWHPRC
jgi:hypothetical protein